MTTTRRLLITLGVSAALAVFAGSCSSDGGGDAATTDETGTTEASGAEAEPAAEEELSYDEGGADWIEFEPACGGSNQSPIDLSEAVEGDIADPTIDWSS